jgi:uncharacterized membrane protein
MRSHARLFGHPVHQMIVPIPLGMFVVGAGLDIAQRFIAASWIPTVSFWDLSIGVVAALVAVVFGAIDLIAIPDGTRAKRVGGLHAIGNVIVVSCIAVSLLIRHDRLFAPAPTLALVLEVAALLLASVTGWLGGELVDRLGVGVEDNANLDAPSSLSHANRSRRSMA